MMILGIGLLAMIMTLFIIAIGVIVINSVKNKENK